MIEVKVDLSKLPWDLLERIYLSVTAARRGENYKEEEKAKELEETKAVRVKRSSKNKENYCR